MNSSPDVLILPSKLAPLARPVLGSLVINPGTLAKGSNGGTYAEMSIHPVEESKIRDAIIAGAAGKSNAVNSFPVHERTAVRLKKI